MVRMYKDTTIRVAGYVRISTDETRQRYSLPAQEKRILEYIKSRRKEGYRLFKIYSDQKSAKDLKRPALRTLLRDAEKGLFSLILVVKLDRLCRRLADQLELTELFQRWGVTLDATDEEIDLETPDGVTFAQIRGAFNESERRKNSYRTKRGMKEKASQGGWCGGVPPFGYRDDKNTKTLVSNPDEVPIVKEIFSLYTQKRLGAKAIALYLNKKGLRTRNGSVFSTSSIIQIITNPSYLGKVRWDGEVFSGKHSPLIDEETFDTAQELLTERRGDPSLRRLNSTNYPFSGLLHCERCGRWLVGVSAHGRNRVYPYYACPGKFKYGECDLESLPKEEVDLGILSQIKRIFADARLINRVLARVNEKRAERIPKKEAELKILQRQISKKKSLIKKYLSTFESGVLKAKSLGERVTEIEEEIALLQERKEYLDDEISRSKLEPVSREGMRKVISKLEEVVLSAGPSERRAFLKNIVKTIKVHPSLCIEPYYRIPSVRTVSGLAPRIGRC